MKKVAILMVNGLSDRIDALEGALEHWKPEEIDIFWLKYDDDYVNTEFTDYFDTNLNNSSINIDYKSVCEIWNIWRRGWCNIKKEDKIFLNKIINCSYDNFILLCPYCVSEKYIKNKKSVLFTNHISFKNKEVFTNNEFVGVHFRWYCPLRNNENYYNNIISSFEKIYDSNKKYFISTDSERIQNYCTKYPNINFIQKKYNKKGFIERSKNNTQDTLNEIKNLGDCGIIYRTMGGFAYLAAAQSKNKPDVLQLEIKKNI